MPSDALSAITGTVFFLLLWELLFSKYFPTWVWLPFLLLGAGTAYFIVGCMALIILYNLPKGKKAK